MENHIQAINSIITELYGEPISAQILKDDFYQIITIPNIIFICMCKSHCVRLGVCVDDKYHIPVVYEIPEWIFKIHKLYGRIGKITIEKNEECKQPSYIVSDYGELRDFYTNNKCFDTPEIRLIMYELYQL